MAFWPPPGQSRHALEAATLNLLRITASSTVGAVQAEDAVACALTPDIKRRSLTKCYCRNNSLIDEPPCYSCLYSLATPPPTYTGPITRKRSSISAPSSSKASPVGKNDSISSTFRRLSRKRNSLSDPNIYKPEIKISDKLNPKKNVVDRSEMAITRSMSGRKVAIPLAHKKIKNKIPRDKENKLKIGHYEFRETLDPLCLSSPEEENTPRRT